MERRVVVYPPDERGWRKVRYDGQILGTAYQASDVVEFLREVGHPDPDAVSLKDESLFEWRGGGPETWADSPL
ncbi:hypothetical protein ACFY0N_30995 [Streptomyces vinaceus]|uniref:hypothetical protein n=1 Tax=Streptomyces vinaceus TaxID=1960 RepID=UPI0036AC85DF